MDPSTRLSVVVPTFGRVKSLERCLEGLAVQTEPPDEIVVVRRREDGETARFLRSYARYGVVEAEVRRPAQAIAMIAGVQRAHGQLLAFTDDDAVPRPNWLGVIRRHLARGDVGGVGGRDVVHGGESARNGETSDVGRITAWGKLIGNHHIGTGGPREVHVLKGANMAFRRRALAIPENLRGSGAQIHQEVAISLWARSRGWKLVYDPAAVVDHYPATRFDADRRDRPDPIAIQNIAYNYGACLLSFEPRLIWRRAAFGLLLGDAGTPGLGRAAVALARRHPKIVRRLAPSLRGQIEALVDLARGQRVSMIAFGNGERQ